jgi:hypothetical protein
MKAKLAAKVRAKLRDAPLKKKKLKTHVADVSADETPPWEDDPPKGKKKKRVVEKLSPDQLRTEAKRLGVRSVGSNEDDEDDLFEEENAIFEKKMKEIAKRVNDKARPYNSPATQEVVTREALASVLRLLAGYENSAKRSNAERAAYAYSNLINQARELMADLRAMSSTDALADRVVQDAVNPLFLGLINYLIQEISTIRTKLNGVSSAETLRKQLNEQCNNILTNVGEFGQESLNAAAEKARESLRN